VISSVALAGDAPLPFRRHDINPESNFSACAAIDVNRDGKLDMVSGAWWYEAPSWKKHALREVELIRGRYDDYSNLPLDVNGDGWLDLVSANYRSRKLYWIEHPGKSLGPWKTHLVDMPGGMETARLVDLDGDGRIDVLPNGTDFAAWWEVKLEKTNSGAVPRWVQHELPRELAGHGIGSGDVNGDGRIDLIGPRGWLEAPADRRKDRWLWHADFDLHRDCGIPILAFDVDADGDNDLVWGRGHHVGIYWLEQLGAGRGWAQHAMDTSWSQIHSLLLADLDNDGRPEVIAGKRYLGHDGRDIGEYDPLMVYAYTFLPKTRSWQRRLISAGGPVGFALDPKAVDLDADGDQDLLASDLRGLYWLENLHVNKSKAEATNRPLAVPAYTDHKKVTVVKDDAGQDQPVKTPFDWSLRRAHVLAHVEKVMGELPGPELRVPLDVKVISEEKAEKYVRQKITYIPEPGDRVPAYLLIPAELKGKAPAMLCLHQTTGIGKGEPAGLGGLRNLHYAHELAERGYVCLAPDYPSFGDYKYDFKAAGRSGTPSYMSGSMKAIWNNVRAVDLLESLSYVNPDKIGCIGHSLGGHNTIFTAVFDQRNAAMVSSSGFTPFHDYYGGKLAGWTSDRYMPRIRTEHGNDPNQVPFDFYELVAALAPRPFFINAPLRDDNFDVNGVKKNVSEAGKVYALLGAKEGLHAVYPEVGHDFPVDVREQAYSFLDKWLKK
jgi:dienelactone hydrolase